MDDSVLTLLGRWAWGACGGVDIHLPYAYIGNGPTIQILDIQNPESPEIIGEYLTNGDIINGLDVRGQYLYASTAGYLLILDISNPNQPVLSGSVETGGMNLTVRDSFAYSLTWGCYLKIIDISNPSNPFLRGGTFVVGDELPANIAVNGKTVYANGMQGYGFSIVDVADPDHPQSYTFEMEANISDLSVYDSLLLVSTLNDSLLVYSVAEPLQPVKLGYILAAHGEIYNTAIHNNIVFATGGGGVYSFDISEPSMPVLRDFYTSNNLTHSFGGINYNNGMIITGVYSGMMLIDAENPDSLKQISFFATAAALSNIKLKDSLALIACANSGLWILDVSDPYHPKTISNVNTGSCAVDLEVEGNFVYVICRNDFVANDPRGLYIIDYSNINQPQIISYYRGIIRAYTTGAYVRNNIAKFGNKIFLTQYLSINDTILEIVDVQNPYSPYQLGVYKSNIYAPYDIAVTDTIIYMGTFQYGMRILNYRNNQPFEVANFFNGQEVWGLLLKDSILYTDRIDTFFVLGVSNPIQPIILGYADRTYGSFSQIKLFVDEKYAYWADEEMGMFNIENPFDPYEIPLQANFDAHSIVAKENMVYIITGEKGLLIFKNNLIVDIKNIENSIKKTISLNNYPNPFNSNTRLSFNMPKNEKIKLDVFNVLGQKVMTIINCYVEKGTHEVDLNFSNLSSGIYIVSLKTSIGVVNKKVTFIK